MMEKNGTDRPEAAKPRDYLVIDGYKTLIKADAVTTRYIIESERARGGEEIVVKLITGRSSDGVTLLFDSAPEKARVILDELMKSGGREEVIKLITAEDNHGNNALFGANPKTAELLIDRLLEMTENPVVVSRRLVSKQNILGYIACDSAGPELQSALRGWHGGERARSLVRKVVDDVLGKGGNSKDNVN